MLSRIRNPTLPSSDHHFRGHHEPLSSMECEDDDEESQQQQHSNTNSNLNESSDQNEGREEQHQALVQSEGSQDTFETNPIADETTGLNARPSTAHHNSISSLNTNTTVNAASGAGNRTDGIHASVPSGDHDSPVGTAQRVIRRSISNSTTSTATSTRVGTAAADTVSHLRNDLSHDQEATPIIQHDNNSVSNNDPNHSNNSHSATATSTATSTASTNLDSNNIIPSNSTSNTDESSNSLSAPFNDEIQSELHSLSEQRDAYTSNTKTWTIIFTILLLKLVLEAFLAEDVGLLFISLICFSYFARWRQWRQLQINRINEQIENLLQLSMIAMEEQQRAQQADEEVEVEVEDGDNDNTTEGEATSRRSQAQRQFRHDPSRRLRVQFSRNNHVDFEMLSFQAQLAFALMESQQFLQNAGHANNPNTETRGVSDDSKQQWQSFEYTQEYDFYQRIQSKKSSSTLKQSNSFTIDGEDDDGDGDDNADEAPTCCICLCEYEKGDKLVQLQCGHAYHSDCIDSWCTNHVRCPLCNLDLDQKVDSNHCDGNAIANANGIDRLDSIV